MERSLLFFLVLFNAAFVTRSFYYAFDRRYYDFSYYYPENYYNWMCPEILKALKTDDPDADSSNTKWRIDVCVLAALRKEYSNNTETGLDRSPPWADEAKPDTRSMDLNFQRFMISSLSWYGYALDMNVAGTAVMSWKDERLHWKKKQFNVASILVDTARYIWTPKLQAAYDEPDASNADTEQAKKHTFEWYYEKINVTADGTVTAQARFYWTHEDTCTFNLQHYPNDDVTCCAAIRPAKYGSQLKFKLNNKPEVSKRASSLLNTEYIFKEFNVAVATQKQDLDSESTQLLNACFRLQRNSVNRQPELTIPMAISGILFMVAPLFPGFRSQAFFKMFAATIQFVCFYTFVQRIPAWIVQAANGVPIIYRYYEFTVAMTVLSLIQSIGMGFLLHYGCSDLPPPHKLSQIPRAIKRALKLLKTSAKVHDSSASDVQPVVTEAAYKANGVVSLAEFSESSSSGGGWAELWLALDAFLTALVMFAYVVGLIVIFTAF